MYHLVTDLATLASLAEEATAMSWRKGDAARPGAVFKGTNRNGFRRWTTTCTVTDAAPGRVFGFDVSYFGMPASHWRYDIAAQADGSRRRPKRPRWLVPNGLRGVGVVDASVVPVVAVGVGVGEILLMCWLPVLTSR